MGACIVPTSRREGTSASGGVMSAFKDRLHYIGKICGVMEKDGDWIGILGGHSFSE